MCPRTSLGDYVYLSVYVVYNFILSLTIPLSSSVLNLSVSTCDPRYLPIFHVTFFKIKFQMNQMGCMPPHPLRFSDKPATALEYIPS